MMDGVAGVFFDLDGTLADTAPDLAAAANRLVMERGQAPVAYEKLRPVASHGARGLSTESRKTTFEPCSSTRCTVSPTSRARVSICARAAERTSRSRMIDRPSSTSVGPAAYAFDSTSCRMKPWYWSICISRCAVDRATPISRLKRIKDAEAGDLLAARRLFGLDDEND